MIDNIYRLISLTWLLLVLLKRGSNCDEDLINMGMFYTTEGVIQNGSISDTQHEHPGNFMVESKRGNP